MSANVKLPIATPSTKVGNGTATAASSPSGTHKDRISQMILPYEVLFKLLGQRITVLLSIGSEELEGVLQTVDDDKGDLFLSDVVHYAWEPQPSAAETASEGSGGTAGAKDQLDAVKVVGGGQRRELYRSAQAMVNSSFVSLITPTLFHPE